MLRLTAVAALALAMVLGLVTTGHAALRSGNLVRNGGFEQGDASPDGRSVVGIPHWVPEPAPTTCSRPGEFGSPQQGYTVVPYGAPDHYPNPVGASGGAFPSAPAGGGEKVLFGGPCGGGVWLRQVISLARWSGAIAARDTPRHRSGGTAMYGVISAQHATSPATPENLRISARFRDRRGRDIALLTPLFSEVRGYPPRLRRTISRTSALPRGVRSVVVEISLSGPYGAYWMDAFVDNVRLELSDNPRIVPSAGRPPRGRAGGSITVRPSTVALGQKAIVRGVRWPARRSVRVTISKQGTALSSSRTTRAGKDGRFALGIEISGAQFRGRWKVVATGGGRRATAWLTVA